MPANKGHVLVLPKKHVQLLTQMPEDDAKELFAVARKLMPVIINTTKAQGVDIYLAQGIEQRIPHLALNLIPRHEKDNENISFGWKKEKADEKELEQTREKMASAVKLS